MRIYIDEAGPFLPPREPVHSFSLVLALITPTDVEVELFYEFLRLRDQWPQKGIEVKGSSLDESQAAEVIDLLVQYDPLVEFSALDMANQPDDFVNDFKTRQADALLTHLTPQHRPTMLNHLQDLARAIREMPNQLFLQAFATMLLVMETIRIGSLYFGQRKPKELGDIAWIIDLKDRAITQMEEMWTTLIFPVSENQFANHNFARLRGADYSFFDARYRFGTAMSEDDVKRHLEWMQEKYGTAPEISGFDAKLLLGEQRVFEDSRNSLGLQLADMLAAILRRALNQRLQSRGWQNFGKLLVRKKRAAKSFIDLGPEREASYLARISHE